MLTAVNLQMAFLLMRIKAPFYSYTLFLCSFVINLIFVHCAQGYALKDMGRLCPSVFERMFRVACDAFNKSLERVLPHFPSRDKQKAIHSSGAPIELRMMLAVMLHWLAGASYLDLYFA
jgi:hypothetical protein